jgi:hypothetical protein
MGLIHRGYPRLTLMVIYEGPRACASMIAIGQLRVIVDLQVLDLPSSGSCRRRVFSGRTLSRNAGEGFTWSGGA